jgi:hypothetical protein
MTPEQQQRAVHVNSATLIMGVTGAGKSALLATLAEYVWETYHLVTLLYSSDGGGFPAKIQALMQSGIMRVWRMRTRDLADGSLSFETCARACQGWWPKVINPRTGETAPGVQLVPPITEVHQMFCPNGHLVRTVPFASMMTPILCPACRVMTDKTNMRTAKSSARTKGFEQVGAVCYDGLSSMLSWLLSDMGQRAGRLELKGEEGAIGGKIISGDMKFGGNTRSHVGFAQSRGEDLVLSTLGIPYLVVPPTFTALTMEVDDEGGLSVRGPKIAGRAKTDEAPQWFGNCLEARVVKDDKDRRVYELVLSEFVDDAGVRHLAKNRADPGVLPAVLSDEALEPGKEHDTAFKNFNLGVFFRLLDEGLARSMAEIAQQYPDAPGLPDGLAEVGESVAAPVAESPSGSPGIPAPGSKAGAASPSAPTSGRGAAASPSGRPGVKAGTPAPVAAPAPAPAPVAAPAPPPVAAARPAAPRTAPRPSPQAQTAAAAPAPAPMGGPAIGPAGTLPAAGPKPVTPAPAVGSPQSMAPGWAKPAAPRPPAPAPRVGSPTPKA